MILQHLIKSLLSPITILTHIAFPHLWLRCLDEGNQCLHIDSALLIVGFLATLGITTLLNQPLLNVSFEVSFV